MSAWSRTWTVLGSLALVLGTGTALAQEGGPGEGQPRRPRGGAAGQPGLEQPRGMRQPAGPFGVDTPEIREEMQRHQEEMRAILGLMRPLMQEIQQKVRELRQGGADRAAIEEALKDYAPKRQEIAGQMVDALATHNENMAKILKEHREAVVKALAERLTQRPPGRAREGGPGGEGFRPRRRPGEGGPEGGARRPRGPEDGAPENF